MLRIIILLIGFMLANNLYASTENAFIPGTQYVIGLSPGVVWATSNQRQTLSLQPDVTNTYTADNNNPAFASGELFLGLLVMLSYLVISGMMPIQRLITVLTITKLRIRMWL
jgi:hypothetical protein